MKDYHNHIISVKLDARSALSCLTALPDIESRTLFVVDDNDELVGTITDGDIRRGLLDGLEITHGIEFFMNKGFKYLYEADDSLTKIKDYRSKGIDFVPVVTSTKKIIKIVDLKAVKALLPATAFLMAGGRGERLRALTDNVPKPILLVGDKPIMQHNIDRLIRYGINEFYISIKYLGNRIKDYFGDGHDKGVCIKYIEEEEPLGTIGALSLAEGVSNEHLLLMNSDLLTNIDYEDFFDFYLQSKADICIASIPYTVNVPYAVLQTRTDRIISFEEKPTYTYYSNGGVYFMRSSVKQRIPYKSFYNATDLMQEMIEAEEDVCHYPVLCYWLDIGRQQDYLKAQEDIKHIKL